MPGSSQWNTKAFGGAVTKETLLAVANNRHFYLNSLWADVSGAGTITFEEAGTGKIIHVFRFTAAGDKIIKFGDYAGYSGLYTGLRLHKNASILFTVTGAITGNVGFNGSFDSPRFDS